ncbi:two-component system sensor histidine kinase/response regulator [Mastigocoleus testarum BC008]|uniref:histidine kinase n=2 Tax=Mastigocoleus TaxID=996924 RepID=A0A0V7ZWK9_9CYAN|nr:two-component system sensor histidine kinase/response regulator [Mastigocoleus testarum BC008]KST69004.1 two-component system sensor histidine kinase/response regulator [Mastigocoleus testarum BC008]
MKKILVIEDEENLRQNIAELLTLEDFKVVVAENGMAGLQVAESEVPDLVICDVMMPELDGYGVLEKLRQNPPLSTIPFIFLTAKASSSDFRQGMELGADDYLTKPFTCKELLRAVASKFKKQIAIDKYSQKQLDELRNNIALSLPHEMRTPLNGILGFSEILRQEAEFLSVEEIQEMAQGINQSGQRLFKLIQKFLLYTELEMIYNDPTRIKSLQNNLTQFPNLSLNKLILEKAKYEKRKVDLQLNPPVSCEVKICSTRLLVVIEELLDNAFKFSPADRIVRVISELKNSTFNLSFIDYGRGMTSEQIRNLGAYKQFERQIYEQQGMGLGLIIAKRMTELHNGKFKIYSEPNKETIVQVQLPCTIHAEDY